MASTHGKALIRPYRMAIAEGLDEARGCDTYADLLADPLPFVGRDVYVRADPDSQRNGWYDCVGVSLDGTSGEWHKRPGNAQATPPAMGPQGPQGLAGPQGPRGLTGAQGPVGATGAVGPAGARGAKGDPGEPGPAGTAAAQGARGPQGLPGPTGPTGPAGPQGPQGPAGAASAKGDKGEKGDTGARGLPGAPGAPGTAGPAGPTGPAGPPGPRGIQGERGLTGAQGPAGPASTKGDKGDPGEPGPQGPAGPAGPAGASGSVGARGPAGAAGAAGPQGATGEPGPTGSVGPMPTRVYGQLSSITAIAALNLPATVLEYFCNGDQNGVGKGNLYGRVAGTNTWVYQANLVGPAGASGGTAAGTQGPKGDTGETGAQGPAGPAGATGAAGPKGDTGATGATGPAGPKGDTGAQGPASAYTLPQATASVLGGIKLGANLTFNSATGQVDAAAAGAGGTTYVPPIDYTAPVVRTTSAALTLSDLGKEQVFNITSTTNTQYTLTLPTPDTNAANKQVHFVAYDTNTYNLVFGTSSYVVRNGRSLLLQVSSDTTTYVVLGTGQDNLLPPTASALTNAGLSLTDFTRQRLTLINLSSNKQLTLGTTVANFPIGTEVLGLTSGGAVLTLLPGINYRLLQPDGTYISDAQTLAITTPVGLLFAIRRLSATDFALITINANGASNQLLGNRPNSVDLFQGGVPLAATDTLATAVYKVEASLQPNLQAAWEYQAGSTPLYCSSQSQIFSRNQRYLYTSRDLYFTSDQVGTDLYQFFAGKFLYLSAGKTLTYKGQGILSHPHFAQGNGIGNIVFDITAAGATTAYLVTNGVLEHNLSVAAGARVELQAVTVRASSLGSSTNTATPTISVAGTLIIGSGCDLTGITITTSGSGQVIDRHYARPVATASILSALQAGNWTTTLNVLTGSAPAGSVPGMEVSDTSYFYKYVELGNSLAPTWIRIGFGGQAN